MTNFEQRKSVLMKKILLLPVLLLLHITLNAATAPDFTVTTSGGQVRKLYQDYLNQQKLMVLEIFFTTCPPCATHAPHLQTLYQSMQVAHPGKVEFMLLSDKNADINTAVAAYLSSKGLTMPAAGSDGGSLAAVQPYKNNTFGLFQGTPTFVVIAPGTGEVFFDIRGNSPQETMSLISQKISELLPSEPCFLKSYFDNPVDSVQLTVDAGGFSTTLIASGTYTLNGIPQIQNTSYTITPFKAGDPLSGLSTYDLVKITTHILGIQPFQYAWQSIAADLNCSGSVTTFDVVEGRKVILGITAGFSGCGGAAWRFVPEPDGAPAGGSCLNFRGIKLGDLNGTYFAPDDKADDRHTIGLVCEDRHLAPGQACRLQMRTDADMQLMGLQMAIGTNTGAIRITRIVSSLLPGFDDESWNEHTQWTKGFTPVSYINPGGSARVEAGSVLLEIEIEALQDIQLADALRLGELLPAEMYESDGPRDLTLDWRTVNSPATKTVSIHPNPAAGYFIAAFESEREGEVLAQLTDIKGAIVFEKSFSKSRGFNSLQIYPGISADGLYALKLDGIHSGKVILQR